MPIRIIMSELLSGLNLFLMISKCVRIFKGQDKGRNWLKIIIHQYLLKIY